MPRLFTVTELIEMGQLNASMENSDFIEEPEWRNILTTGYAQLYSIVVNSGLRYFERVDTISSVADTAEYDLPADFLSSVGVDYKVDTAGRRRALTEIMAQERNMYRGSTGNSEASFYAFIADKLVLYPTPLASQTYEHVYIPQPKDLRKAPADEKVDVVTPDGEAFLLWHATVRARSKEESDVQIAIVEREQARKRVQEWAVLRSFNSPRRMVAEEGDEYADEYGRYDRWGYYR